MIVLDTNVLSALMLEPPDENVSSWLNRQPRTSIWMTSITAFEIHFGLEIMTAGKRRTALLQGFERLLAKLDHRVVPLDHDAAQRAAELMALLRRQGRPRELRDAMIAGIVLAHRATLATRNTAHFEGTGITLIDPWKA
jgi:predicted nucleic acid-binding protein